MEPHYRHQANHRWAFLIALYLASSAEICYYAAAGVTSSMAHQVIGVDRVEDATLRAGAGCGRSAAPLVVNDGTASPPPRGSHLGRKRHQRYVAYF